MIEKCNILGVNISAITMATTLQFICSNLDKWKTGGSYICVSNVHTTVYAYDHKNYKNIQNQAVLALPDGKPLSILCKMKGYRFAERVTGPDLMGEIFRLSEIEGYRHYFYGSTNETLEALKKNVLKIYPRLEIAGMYSPPFHHVSNREDDEIVGLINAADTDFIWVGLGAPKQEVWMSNHNGRVKGLMIGVGAGFDYYAGNIKRAPLWMQNLSLEWVYRLFQDPKRLFKRYAYTNIKFLLLLLKGFCFGEKV